MGSSCRASSSTISIGLSQGCTRPLPCLFGCPSTKHYRVSSFSSEVDCSILGWWGVQLQVFRNFGRETPEITPKAPFYKISKIFQKFYQMILPKMHQRSISRSLRSDIFLRWDVHNISYFHLGIQNNTSASRSSFSGLILFHMGFLGVGNAREEQNLLTSHHNVPKVYLCNESDEE